MAYLSRIENTGPYDNFLGKGRGDHTEKWGKKSVLYSVSRFQLIKNIVSAYTM